MNLATRTTVFSVVAVLCGCGPETPNPVDGGTDAGSVVCSRWNGDRTGLVNGTWTDWKEDLTDPSQCNAGVLSDEGRRSALRLVNLYRWIAGLPEVATNDTTLTQTAQECALFEHVNLPIWGGNLHHTGDIPANPPPYCDFGNRKDAANYNLAGWAPIDAVDDWMVDTGSIRAGHRRTILRRLQGANYGIGSAQGVPIYQDVSCQMVGGGTPYTAVNFVAWPAPGDLPSQALIHGGHPLDQGGWHVEVPQKLDNITTDTVRVSRLDNGTWTALPVDVSKTDDSNDSNTAILIKPTGWSILQPQWYTEPNKRYRVQVDPASIEYEFQVVDCSSNPSTVM